MASTDPCNLSSYELHAPPPKKKHIGDLVLAFNEYFFGWSLVPVFYCANEHRDKCKLYVTRSISVLGDRFSPMLREELEQMESFLQGYRRGRRDADGDPC